MNVLLVKMSSMGDVVHALYAVHDAAQCVPGIRFDWVVEEAFAALPALHTAVDNVIPVAIRRWRRKPLEALRSGEIRRFRRGLGDRTYDCVLDAQGLLKSAVVSLGARGPRVGLDRHSARESLAALAYERSVHVPGGHAVARLRELFANALGYEVPDTTPDAGLLLDGAAGDKSLVFVHGTTWVSKEYPVAHWRDLCARATDSGFHVVLPAGNEIERVRGHEIAAGFDAEVLYRPELTQLAEQMAAASGVISVDSGLGHLADALGVPLIAVFGSTSPVLTGPRGARSEVIVSTTLPCVPCLQRKCRFHPGEYANIHPPCYEGVAPATVWAALRAQMDAPGLRS